MRCRLFSVGLALIGTAVSLSAQSMPQSVPTGVGTVNLPQPPMPLPPPDSPKPSKELPPTPSLLPFAPPTSLPVGGCASCGDTPGGCGSELGCDGFPLRVGPKYAVEIDYTHGLFWVQPKQSTFPLATINGQSALDGQDDLGLLNTFGFNLKMWLDHEHRFGLGGGGFISENRSRFDSLSSGPGGATISRPFFDAVTGINSSLLVSDGTPGTGFPGSISTRNAIRLAGGDIHIRRNILTSETCRIDLFAGFRYYDLNESFTIYQATGITNQAVRVGGSPNLLTPGTTVNLRDRSYTRNQFYGGEVGAYTQVRHGMLFGSLTPRLAFGPYHQVSRIEGETTTSTNTDQPVIGGLLAAGQGPTNGNIQRVIENRMGIAVNVAAQGGINLTEQLSFAVGYQFLYFGDVVRPLSQFSPTINPRVIPVSNSFGSVSGPAAPLNRDSRESFYAHGATITIQLAY